MKQFLLIACLVSASCWACTDFLLKCEDGTIIASRSMEFAQHLPTTLVAVPPGQKMQSPAPNGKHGMAWTSKYGFVAMMVDKNLLADGFNEKGLSCGILWFYGADYPDASDKPDDTILGLVELPYWLLGNFATVAEARDALKKVNVYGYVVPFLKEIPPIHFSIHDAEGNSLVIEFLDGQMHLWDNGIGVCTNSPSYPWQTTNLRNYVNLRALNAGPMNLSGTVLWQTGQGTGMLGIPGDWTPPSRFVRIALFKDFLATPKTATQGISAGFHLLNTVDIPFGDVVESRSSFDYTQWAVVKDLTHKKLYFRTYEDLNIRTVEIPTDLKAPKALAAEF
jgi:choloylglycine hydrolase